MPKRMKTKKGKDNLYYPCTSPDLVIDDNGESQTTKNTSMKTDIDDIKADLGTGTLNTTAKDIKGAVNELNTKIGTGGTSYDDTEIDEVFNELSMKSLKRYKINYNYDKSMCSLNPTPSYMYENDEVCIQMSYNPNNYVMELISIMQGKNDITNDAFSNDEKIIKLNSINNNINIKIVFRDNGPV